MFHPLLQLELPGAHSAIPSRAALGQRSAVSFGVLALLFGSGIALPASASASESLPDIERSIVYVQTEFTGYVGVPDASGAIAFWSPPVTETFGCTGWFADDRGHIVTAGHCVDDDGLRQMIIEDFLESYGMLEYYAEAVATWPVEGLDEQSDIDRVVSVVQPPDVDDPVIDRPMVAQVVDFEPFEQGDTALLRVAGLTATPGLMIAASAPAVGDELVAIGFPGSVQDVVDVSRLRASFKTGTVSSQQVLDSGVAVTEINAQVSAGMSGGPTVDANGNVLGVNSFGIGNEPQSFNFITDTEGLVGLLEANDVDFLRESVPVPTPPRGDDAELPAMLIPIGIAVGSAGVAAALVLLVARRRGPRPVTPLASTSGTYPTASQGQPGAAADEWTPMPA